MSSISWDNSYYGVNHKSGNRHFVVSAKPKMVGCLDAAVKCCETMGNWRLPTFREMELIAANICLDESERRSSYRSGEHPLARRRLRPVANPHDRRGPVLHPPVPSGYPFLVVE